MPTIARIRCSACDVALRVTLNAAARAVRCPKCSGSVEIPAEGDIVDDDAAETKADAAPAAATETKRPRRSRKPSADDTEDDRDGDDRSDDSSSSPWRWARHGLLVLMIVACGKLLQILGSLLLLVIPFFIGPSAASNLFVANTGLSILLTLASIVGMTLLVFVPSSHAPRKLIIACVAISALLGLYGLFTQYRLVGNLRELSKATRIDRPRSEKITETDIKEIQEASEKLVQRARTERWWLIPITVFGMISYVLYLIYLRQLAESAKEKHLVASCEFLLKVQFVSMALTLIPQLFMLLPIGMFGVILLLFGVVGILGLVLSLCCLGLEIQITFRLRNALEDGPGPSRKRKKRRTAVVDD